MKRDRYDPKARRAARLGAVQALFQMDLGGTGIDAIIEEFKDHRFGHEIEGEPDLPAGDLIFFEKILRGVIARQTELDPAINTVLRTGWPLARLDATLRAVIRAGAFELLDFKDIPERVIINEYLDIAHAFFTGDEPGFVNGVLDRLAREWRPPAIPTQTENPAS